MTDRIKQMSEVQGEVLELFRRKNTDYGDSFATYGPVGVLVRIGDKISRLNSITSTGVNLVNTESLRDTLIDLHNYAAMAVMLIDEGKPIIDEGRQIAKESTPPINKRVREIKKQEKKLQFPN